MEEAKAFAQSKAIVFLQSIARLLSFLWEGAGQCLGPYMFDGGGDEKKCPEPLPKILSSLKFYIEI